MIKGSKFISEMPSYMVLPAIPMERIILYGKICSETHFLKNLSELKEIDFSMKSTGVGQDFFFLEKYTVYHTF